MSGRRLAMAAAVLVAVAASGVALAARAPVTSKQLASLRVDQAAPTTTSTTAAPATFTPSSLTLANRSTPTAGTAGRPESGDTVTVTFSAPVNQSTLCSAWTTNQSSRTLTGVTVTIDNDGPANDGNDRLTVTAASGCTNGFKGGATDLGSKAFVASSGNSFQNVPFANSTVEVVSTSSASTLTIRLGTPDTGNNNGVVETVATQTTAVYTPDSGLKSVTGAAVSGTASVTAVQL